MNSPMTATPKPTALILESAVTALVTARFSAALPLLEELGRRADNSQLLLSARSYRCPESLVELLQDRIDLVNAKVVDDALDWPTVADAVDLDMQADKARQAGKFDAAVGLISVGEALRNGQLTRKQLHGDSARCRMFGGEAIGL